MTDSKTLHYDVIVFGAGIAGLWLGCSLKRAGYNVIVIEKNAAGAGQTLASQGMIHGGQKYTLTGKVTEHAASAAAMVDRWESCLGGWGELDLTSVKILSDTQVMWPAGGALSDAAVFGAAKIVSTDTKKLKPANFPEALAQKKKFKGPVYELPEKVVDAKSLVAALMTHLKGRVFKGEATELLPDGQVAVNGRALQAQAVIFAAGTGNEDALKLLKIKSAATQRRPLRQVMVKPMPYALYGHCIAAQPKPVFTITSHLMDVQAPEVDYEQYIWYLGGNVAEQGATMTEEETVESARKELAQAFPDIDWTDKEWATWSGDRAEPANEKGDLPPGPALHQRGRVLFAWPVKLTFAPALGDSVMAWLKSREIAPSSKTAPPDFPAADMAALPWEGITWRKF